LLVAGGKLGLHPAAGADDGADGDHGGDHQEDEATHHHGSDSEVQPDRRAQRAKRPPIAMATANGIGWREGRVLPAGASPAGAAGNRRRSGVIMTIPSPAPTSDVTIAKAGNSGTGTQRAIAASSLTSPPPSQRRANSTRPPSS